MFGLVGSVVAEKYAIERVIGEGGYGVVYAARHVMIGRSVALKCMKPLGTSAEDTARATALFLREAQMLFSMSHPGIVRFYDVGTLTAGFAEIAYVVLELVEGRSLEEDIDARAASNRPYSREWSDGLGEPGPATDVFSLALTFAEACTLKLVLEAPTPAQIFGAVMAQGRKVTLEHRPDLPSSLQLVFDRALQVRPTDRYASARDMLADVLGAFSRNAVAPLPNLETRPAPPPAVARRPARWPIPALAVASLAMLGIGVFAGRRSMRGPALPPASTTASSASAMASGSSSTAPAAPAIAVTMTAIAYPSGAQHTSEQLLAAFEASREEVLRCQRAGVAASTRATADLNYFVAIHPTGFVWSALDLDEIDPLVERTLDRWTDRCIMGIIMALRFPAHDKDDLAGAVLTLRLRPGAPDTTAPPEPTTTTTYDSTWIKEKPKKQYPDYTVTMVGHGRITSVDYDDGTGVCIEYDKKLACRWVQIDSNGRATLTRAAQGGTLSGRWGFGEDSTSKGSWKLSPPKPKGKPARAKPR